MTETEQLKALLQRAVNFIEGKTRHGFAPTYSPRGIAGIENHDELLRDLNAGLAEKTR